jgi:hypothetical protein
MDVAALRVTGFRRHPHSLARRAACCERRGVTQTAPPPGYRLVSALFGRGDTYACLLLAELAPEVLRAVDDRLVVDGVSARLCALAWVTLASSHELFA